MNYIKIKSLIEKVNRDMPDTFKYNTSDVYEWIWEAIQNIGTYKVYEMEDIEMNIEKGIGTIPNYVQEIKSIFTSEGYPLVQTANRFSESTLNVYKYMINGNKIITTYTGDKLVLSVRKFPVDKDGLPLIMDEQVVIEAVVSFIIYKVAKKEWIKGKIRDGIYRELELDYLTNVKTAMTKMNIPSEDEMRGLMNYHELGVDLYSDLGGGIQNTIEVYNMMPSSVN